MVNGCRTRSRKNNRRRRRVNCVTRASYGGRLEGLRGLGVSWFSFRAYKWRSILS